jgi:hypothetical protein
LIEVIFRVREEGIGGGGSCEEMGRWTVGGVEFGEEEGEVGKREIGKERSGFYSCDVWGERFRNTWDDRARFEE